MMQRSLPAMRWTGRPESEVLASALPQHRTKPLFATHSHQPAARRFMQVLDRRPEGYSTGRYERVGMPRERRDNAFRLDSHFSLPH